MLRGRESQSKMLALADQAFPNTQHQSPSNRSIKTPKREHFSYSSYPRLKDTWNVFSILQRAWLGACLVVSMCCVIKCCVICLLPWLLPTVQGRRLSPGPLVGCQRRRRLCLQAWGGKTIRSLPVWTHPLFRGTLGKHIQDRGGWEGAALWNQWGKRQAKGILSFVTLTD